MLEARPDAPVPAPQTSPPFPLLCSGKTQKRGIRLQRHFRGNDSSPLPTILPKQPHSMPIPAAMETEGYDDLILAPRIDRSKGGSLGWPRGSFALPERSPSPRSRTMNGPIIRDCQIDPE